MLIIIELTKEFEKSLKNRDKTSRYYSKQGRDRYNQNKAVKGKKKISGEIDTMENLITGEKEQNNEELVDEEQDNEEQVYEKENYEEEER